MAAAALLSGAATACKGANDNKGAEARIAFDKALNAYNSGNGHLCVELLDSLDRKYADDNDVMKQSIKLRPQALMLVNKGDMAVADSIVNANKALLDSLKPLMVHIDVPGTEGYMIKSTSVDPGFMNRTGVSPRVSEIGEFYLVTSVNPAGGLQHWSLTAAVGDMMATTDTVPYDGALNFRTNNSEVITFTPAGSDTIGSLIAQNPGLPVKILFNGQNGRSHSITLNAGQIDGIATAYRYALAVNTMRDATVELERLNARQAALQKQIDANDAGQREAIDTEKTGE